MMKPIIDGDNRGATLVLAHGAGAGMNSPFMEEMARKIACAGIRVVRFEFPYMDKRRQTGRKSPPDRQPVLLQTWRDVLSGLGDSHQLFIGGKSMGGRMATLLATQIPVRGVVCLGYPFHPPGKPEKLRIEHFPDLDKTPVLFVQGERDRLGRREEVQHYRLPVQHRLCWLADGDHDFKPRVRSGVTHEQNLQGAADAVIDFIRNP